MEVFNNKSKFLKEYPFLKQISQKAQSGDDFIFTLESTQEGYDFLENFAKKQGLEYDEAGELLKQDIYPLKEPDINSRIKQIKQEVKRNGGDLRGLESAFAPEFVHTYKQLNNLDEIAQRGAELKSFKSKDKFYDEALKALKNNKQAPADYMEAKRLDNVKLDESSRIIVPSEAYDDIARALKEQGLEIPLIKKRKNESLNQAIKRSSDNSSKYIYAKGADNLAGGLVAGVEQDENGNISINPAKFVAGFGGIMLAKKALSNLKSNKAKELLNSAIKHQEKAIQENNLRKGFTTQGLLTNTLGAGTGGAVGYGIGDNDDERFANALTGALAGLGVANAGALAKTFREYYGKRQGIAKEIAKNSPNQDKVYKHLKSFLAAEANKEWGDISSSILGSLRLNFTNTLSGAYKNIRNEARLGLNQKAIKVERLANALKSLDEADRVAIHNALVDEGVVSSELKPLVDNIKSTINNLEKELVQSGVLSKEAYDEWAGAYLHRSYEAHRAKGALNKISSFKLDKIHSRGKTETINQMEYMQRLSNDKDFANKLNLPLRKGGIRAKSLPNGKVELRRDYSYDERTAMGEIRDSAYTVPETIFKLERMIENAKFLKEVAKTDKVLLNAKFASSFSPDELYKAGYVKLGVNARYGALSGQFIRKDVANDIKGISDRIYGTYNGEQKSILKETWDNYWSLWKKSKTVWNIPAHVNNFLSNMFLVHLMGHNEAVMAKEFFNTMKAYSPAKLKRYDELNARALSNNLNANEITEFNTLKQNIGDYIEARDLGLLGRSQLNDITDKPINDFTKNNVLKKLDNIASAMYSGEDDFGRVFAYKLLKDKGFSKDEVSKIVLAMMPDYTEYLPKSVKALRDWAIAPFISWSYFVLPKMSRMLMSKIGSTQALKVLAGIGAIEYIASNGEITPLDNIPFMDTKKPQDFKGREIVIGKNGDKLTTAKADRIIPYVSLLDIGNLISGIFSAPPITLAKDMLDTTRGVTPISNFNNRAITYPNKSKDEKLKDYAEHFVGSYTPIPQSLLSVFNTARAMNKNKEKRRKSNVIQPRSFNQELLKLLGVNSKTYSLRGLKKEQKKER